MLLKTKRIYDRAEPDDGYRLLVMRLWPRGIRKDSIDAWERELAPSEQLRVAYLHGGMPWETYAQKYVEEVGPRRHLMAQLVRQVQGQTVTLLCSCKDEARCHRTLLKGLVEGA